MWDGAAPNLIVLKSTHGHPGAHNVNPELSDEYQVEISYANIDFPLLSLK